MSRPERKQRGGASASPPGATGYLGVSLTPEGRYRATITRTFATLEEARAWRTAIQPDPEGCRVCGRGILPPRRVFCSDACDQKFDLQRNRERVSLVTQRFRKCERNIRTNGTKFQTAVSVNGQKFIRTFGTLEEARAYRDRQEARRAAARPKACLVCGKPVTQTSRSPRYYCSNACNEKALKSGKLVKPRRALPSTRRRVREVEKARIQAHKVEILSGPGTFADAYEEVQEILRKHVEKQKGEAA